MRFLHAADLHLDSPLRGLEAYEGAPVEAIRSASRRALEALVDCALAESVDLLLLAGDLYDGDWKDYGTGLFFASQMRRLADAGIPVVLVRGNHDAHSEITRSLRLPDTVHTLSADAPETVRFEALGVAVHGQSFPTRAVTENLAAAYPEPLPGLLNIGLLHTALDGRTGHDPYAPCTAADLAAKGYRYWALGHVHTREIVARDPWIVFPGNLQGRHIRETGAKGAYLVEADGDAIRQVHFVPLDVFRFERLSIDAGEARHPDELVEAAEARLADLLVAAEGRPLGVRLSLTGASEAHPALSAHPERWISELRAAADRAGSGRIWLETVRLDTRPKRDLAAEDPDGPIGTLLSTLEALRADPGALGALAEAAGLPALQKKIAPALGHHGEPLAFDDPEPLQARLEEAQALLLGRLAGTGGEGEAP